MIQAARLTLFGIVSPARALLPWSLGLLGGGVQAAGSCSSCCAEAAVGFALLLL